MQYKEMNGEYYLRVDKDEELIQSIQKLATKEKITGGHFTGIGAVGELDIATYIASQHDFLHHHKKGLFEMVSLTGTIAYDGEQPVIHTHAAFSYLNDQSENAMIAGDLKSAIISYTGEIIVTPARASIPRRFDPDTGIDVWDLS